MWTRRQILRLGAATAGGLLLPRLARAAGSERRFLFVWARGGWDPTRFFAPLFDASLVDMESDAQRAETAGISWVDSPQRPTVRSFMESWGDRLCLVNGLEVRSVAHERCTRLLFTGRGGVGSDGWPSILAGNASGGELLPHLVMSGPAYTNQFTGAVVRVGSNGQLPSLLDGRTFDELDGGLRRPSQDREALVDALVRSRTQRFAGGEGSGRQSFGQGYGQALDDLSELQEVADTLSLEGGTVETLCGGVMGQLDTALEVLSAGLCRTALVTYQGWCEATFDTHSNNEMQSTHFEELFMHLQWLMQELEARPASGGGSLAGEVVVVVLSEMGRHPQLNTHSGKDHWTFTSAMLLGPGVRGGQVVGDFDDQLMGKPVSLSDGQPDEGGTSLLPEHLGATLLALGDVDPADYVDADPIDAVLE